MTAPGESDSLLEWLQDWYARQCDGDWEHQYGVTIDNIDNPGWRVKIDLKGTSHEGRAFDLIKVDNSESDWFHYWAAEGRFEAAGGPTNLGDILAVFRSWVENTAT